MRLLAASAYIVTFFSLATVAVPTLHSEEPILFRISVENVSSHFQSQFVRRFAETLSTRAGPGVKVEFYDGARLFRDADILAALVRGSVEMAVPGIWQFDKTVPDTAILMLPTLYGKPGIEVRDAVDGPLGSLIAARFEGSLPVKVIGGWLDLGNAHIFCAGRKTAPRRTSRASASVSPVGRRTKKGYTRLEGILSLFHPPTSLPIWTAASSMAYSPPMRPSRRPASPRMDWSQYTRTGSTTPFSCPLYPPLSGNACRRPPRPSSSDYGQKCYQPAVPLPSKRRMRPRPRSKKGACRLLSPVPLSP